MRVKGDLPGVGFQKKIVGFVATVTLHATHVSFRGQRKPPLVGYLKMWSYRGKVEKIHVFFPPFCLALPPPDMS